MYWHLCKADFFKIMLIMRLDLINKKIFIKHYEKLIKEARSYDKIAFSRAIKVYHYSLLLIFILLLVRVIYGFS
mgnify:CR=1 FL=1